MIRVKFIVIYFLVKKKDSKQMARNSDGTLKVRKVFKEKSLTTITKPPKPARNMTIQALKKHILILE